MPSLKDKVREQEEKQDNKKEKLATSPSIIGKSGNKYDTASSGKSAVRNIAGGEIKKDKQISAKVNEVSYAKFTKINQIQGLSNNSALNMIISRYIRENSALLDE